MHDILMLMPLILTMLFFNRGSIERFENEKCDITDRKIKLLEEKIVLETNQNTKGSLHSKEIEIKINELSEKIKELDKKIIENNKKNDEKISSEINDFKKEEEKEEEEVYTSYLSWNRLTEDNYLINALLVFFCVLLIIFIFYILISNVMVFTKKRKLKIDKVNVKYDNILDELKKSKVKSSLKVKKGKFFSF